MSGPVFIDGIGPPLQQIEADYGPLSSREAKDVLALIAEVYRLLDRLEAAERAGVSLPGHVMTLEDERPPEHVFDYFRKLHGLPAADREMLSAWLVGADFPMAPVVRRLIAALDKAERELAESRTKEQP